MNDYTQLMDGLKNTSVRLNKDNYQKAFSDIGDFFKDAGQFKKDYNIGIFTRNADFREVSKNEPVTFERISGPKASGSTVNLLYAHFLMAPLDNPFMQDIQVDTYSKSQNSHKFELFQKDGISGLYLMNDFLPENLEIPEERLFIVKK